MSALWGSMHEEPVETNIGGMDRELLMKVRNMEVEGPPLHQPSSKHFPPVNEAHKPDAFQMDSITLHTIRLIQHARRMRGFIQTANVQLQELKNNEISEIPSFASAPAIPEYTGRKLQYRDALKQPLFFLPQNVDSDFVRGIWKPPPEIDHRTNRRLLRKSVAAICAHTGFDNCCESVLETLTDISHEYLMQFTKQLRRAVDHSQLHEPSGFPDPVEQVFHEMGLGSTTILHDFYQNRVIRYHDNMMQTCKQLMADYEKVTHPDVKLTEDVKPHRVKDELVSDINFPSMDESEEGTDSEQVLQLEGLGLDIAVQSSGSLSQEEDSKWSAAKTEPTERFGSLEQYEADDSSASEVPRTPALSDTGDSSKDPGSVPEILASPPSSGGRSKPPKKKRKK